MVKNHLPSRRFGFIPSRGGGDTLEKEMATFSCILAWETPWTEEPGWPQSVGSQRLRYDLAIKKQLL